MNEFLYSRLLFLNVLFKVKHSRIPNNSSLSIIYCNEDEENPTFTELQTENISLSVSCNKLNAAVNWAAPNVTDNSGYFTLSSNYKPGDQFPVDNTTMVTYYATDPSGNIASFSVFVTLSGK